MSTSLLDEIAAAWAANRTAALAALLEEARAKATATPPALPTRQKGLSGAALVTAWSEALAKSSRAQYGAVVPALGELLRTTRGTWPLVEVLSELPADPRLGDLCLDLLEGYATLPFTSGKLWRRLVDGVERHGDERAPARLRALDASTQYDSERTRVENVAKRLERAARPFDVAPLRARLGRWDGAAPASGGSEEALLAAIHADPASDGPRAVYADALLARGDVRGEFISLQLARAASGEPPTKRELALQKKHQHAWLARLWPLLATKKTEPLAELVFERGFLAGVRNLFVPRGKRFLLDDPMWSTVRWIEDELPTVGAHMRALERVEALDGDALTALARLASVLPLEELVLRYSHRSTGLATPLPQLGRLRRLTVRYDGEEVFPLLRQVLAQPWRLERLEIAGASYTAWAWDWAVLDAARSVPELTLSLEEDSQGETLTLLREPDGRLRGRVTVDSVWSLREWALVFAPFTGARKLTTLEAVGRKTFGPTGVPPFLALLQGAADRLVLEGSLAGAAP